MKLSPKAYVWFQMSVCNRLDSNNDTSVEMSETDLGFILIFKRVFSSFPGSRSSLSSPPSWAFWESSQFQG